MVQKPRMPQIQGVKGEAVVRYCSEVYFPIKKSSKREEAVSFQ
jgi:hypothetical protein